MSMTEYIRDQLSELESKLESVGDVSSRYQGMSIDYRKCEPLWDKPWRLKFYTSKNSNAEKRTVTYFDSFIELLDHINKL